MFNIQINILFTILNHFIIHSVSIFCHLQFKVNIILLSVWCHGTVGVWVLIVQK
jgi:hypothetical protein